MYCKLVYSNNIDTKSGKSKMHTNTIKRKNNYGTKIKIIKKILYVNYELLNKNPGKEAR
jgi:hypothetical protein